jgi:hypothetical protein
MRGGSLAYQVAAGSTTVGGGPLDEVRAPSSDTVRFRLRWLQSNTRLGSNVCIEGIHEH